MSKFRILCLAAAFALSAHAASPIKKANMGGVSGWGVSYGGFLGPDTGALGLDYKSSSHEIGFGLAARMIDYSASDSFNDHNIAGLHFHVGAREMVKPKLALSGGFSAQTALVDKWSAVVKDHVEAKLSTIPYKVGFYSGLSFEPTKNIAAFVRNDLVSYTNPGMEDRPNQVDIFGNVAFGLTYYWQN